MWGIVGLYGWNSPVARFLRTKDFELFGQNQHRMVGVQSEQRCIELCLQQGNASAQCNSLEYTPAHEECVFSAETAVPVGNGQLRQRPGTDYLERVCVDQKLARLFVETLILCKLLGTANAEAPFTGASRK